MQFNYSDLETVHTGEEVDEVLPRHVEQSGAGRVFLVGSNSLAQATEQFAALRNKLGERCVGLFTGIGTHTPRQDVMALLAEVREAEADLLVSLGGGSVIDACKVIQLALNQNINSEDELLAYAQRANGSRGARHGAQLAADNSCRVRQVAVPTTLSGAEFSNNAGVLDTATNAKEGYRAKGLCPQAIIYDPALTVHTPEWLFLSTAIRSLDHAIEGFCSADTTDYHDGHFLHAMKLFAQSLPQIKTKPADLDARSVAQTAVCSACCGLGTVSHGASHGIGYILGSLHGVPHGHTSCVMLPAVLQWNEERLADRCQQIAAALGTENLNAALAVKKLVADLGLPTSLQAVGIKRPDIDEIATRAFRHPVVRNNPRPIDSAQQVREILELAWQ